MKIQASASLMKLRQKSLHLYSLLRAKGQGFGLAVCKRVMEAQGGTISFDSQVGKGTAFIVGLPLKGVKP